MVWAKRWRIFIDTWGLHVARIRGDVSIAELLRQHGGGEQIAGALHGAVRFSRLAMAEWLLKYGADLQRLNFQGKTPLESARELGDAAMVELVERYAPPPLT